jgi:hypothetical protein
MFKVLSLFEIDAVGKTRADVQVKFDSDLRKLTKRRAEHNAHLNPKLADKNREVEWNKLCAEEAKRAETEAGLIARFNSEVIACEFRGCKLYSTHLGMVASHALELFDSYVVIEDLTGSATADVPRKTMKELMKEKARKGTGANDPNGRPFHTRDWPTLPMVMAPLLSITAQKRTDTPPSEPLASAVRSKRERGRRDTEKSAPAEPAKEFVQVSESLDTALSRGLIVERNHSYESYQAALAKRLHEFQIYIDSLKAEADGFTVYWQKCVASLKDMPKEPEPQPVN